jgi:hypothetical protein
MTGLPGWVFHWLVLMKEYLNDVLEIWDYRPYS